ncbi:MAG: hypothetical protein Q4B26_09655 [Eubacteriales bacterium]|nr:hypothetical protein [Eubacteriales bacterium]
MKGKVPEGFTVSMALVDCIPVVFFSIMMSIVSLRFQSIWFYVGVFLVILAGALKCLWKFLVAIVKKNIYPLFLQMRILMPAGFLLILVSLWIDREKISAAAIVGQITSFPAVLFYGLGILGMCAMMIFAKKLDPADARSNWIEQGTNGVAQLCFLIAIVL